ncbi:MAG TPA: hypothetical protein PK020_06115 [Ilumatobacteraceae bacterium]|nr:hypothetical protein [Ilumatobacteraceae bacterium]HRB01808.1 hypothetical protein [Ilumatobacteraceae bacterium]
MSEWADLRQVVVATTDADGVVTTLREQLALGASFGDPELAAHGIADETFAVGSHAFLEVVSPLTADHPMAAWLAGRGGSAGYLLSVQVSDVDACLERCSADGIRVPLTQFVQGHRIAQLHRGDMRAGLELDGIAQRGRWFWDALEIDRPTGALVDDVVGVEIAVDDPQAAATRWAYVLGLEQAVPMEVDLSGRAVRFVPRADVSGIVAVDLRAVDRNAVGSGFTVGGVQIRLV